MSNFPQQGSSLLFAVFLLCNTTKPLNLTGAQNSCFTIKNNNNLAHREIHRVLSTRDTDFASSSCLSLQQM